MAEGFRIDEAAAKVWLNGAQLELSPKAFGLLVFLIQNAGRIVTPDQLLEAVWPDTNVQPEILKVYILELRRALDDDARNPRYIETVPRRGYRLIAPNGNGAAPVPVASASGRPLFGRDAELGELMDAFQLASSGARQTIFITGEPGIGKTALVEAFTAWLAASAGAHVLRGQCIRTYGEQEPYYPLLEALTGMRLAGFRKAMTTHAPTWLIQLPSVLPQQEREKLSKELPGAGPSRMLREICDLLQAVSRESLLVLVLEDAQWADAATVDFLSAVARRREPAKLMILCTFRRADLVVARHPLRTVSHELGAKSLSREIRVKPLDAGSVRRFLDSEFPGNPPPGRAVEAIADYSGGNPLFLASIAARLRDAGLRGAESDWVTGVSEQIQELILGQAEILNRAERELLDTAVVVGSSFSVWSVAALVPDTPENVEARCEALAAGYGWLRFAGAETLPGGGISPRFEFNNRLYRDAIYRRLDRAFRSSVQQRLAEAIESLYGENAIERAVELAWRFEECRRFDKAIHYLRLAAERALHRRQPRQAAAFLKRAGRFAAEIAGAETRQDAQLETLRLLAQARFSAGQLVEGLDAAEKLAAAAVLAGRWDVAARASLAASHSWGFVDYRRALASAARAEELSARAGDPPLAAQAQVEKNCLALLLDRWDAAGLERAREGIAWLRHNGEPPESAWHESRDALLRLYASDYEGAHAVATRVHRAAERQGDLVTAETACRLVRSSLLAMGRWGEFQRECETSIARHERNNNEAWAHLSRAHLALLYLECFDFKRALDVCDGARYFARPSVFAVEQLAGCAAAAYAGLGEHELALERIAEGQAAGEGLSYLPHRFMLLCAAVEAELSRRDYDAALLRAQEALRLALDAAELTYQALAWYWMARTRRLRGEPAEARAASVSALALVERANLPRAAWRVYTEAGEFEKAGKAVAKLAASLGAGSALGESFTRGAAPGPRGASAPHTV